MLWKIALILAVIIGALLVTAVNIVWGQDSARITEQQAK